MESVRLQRVCSSGFDCLILLMLLDRTHSAQNLFFFFTILSTTALKIFLAYLIVRRFRIGKGARPYAGLGIRRQLLLSAVNWMGSWEKQS